MEVTNTNSSQFAPKLGQADPDTLSSDAFAAHLAETDTYASEHAEPRVDDRKSEADDRRADERQADADKADAADDDRKAEDRDADARSDEDAETAEDQNAEGGESDTDLALADADAEGLLEDDATITDGEEAILESEIAAVDDQDGADLSDDPTLNTDDALNAADAAANTDDAPLQTATKDAEYAANAESDEDGTEELSADELARQAAHSSNAGATTNADTTSAVAAQQAARPGANAASQTGPQGTQAVAGAGDQSSGLPNPLEGGLQSDVEGDADGERGLGHQAADTMAGKNKASATNFQTPAAQPATAPAPAMATAAVTPVQAMAAAGLNLSSLPTDLNLDLLNLNSSNQSTAAPTPQNSNPVMVRFGALPGQAQATQVPNTAIALQISKHIARGVSTFEIRLDPAEMGRVDVKLELAQDGRVTAHLTVEKSETLELLQRDAKALEQALKDAGLDADSDTLNFSLKNGGGDQANGSDADSQTANDDPSGEGEETDDLLLNAVAARQIEAAARGGIDVSI
eukprot:s1_g2393.t1